MSQTNTRAISISKHERDHAIAACFAALTTLDANPDVKLSYDAVDLDVLIAPEDGHVVASIRDAAKHPKHMELSRQIAGLAALGPAAQMDDPTKALRAKDYGALASAAKLSQEDLDLLNGIEGQDATVRLARVVLATKAYYEAIGIAGQQRLAKTLRHGSNQGLRAWKAAELMPEHVARKMLARADAQLKEIMGAQGTEDTAAAEVQAIVSRTNRAPVKGRI